MNIMERLYARIASPKDARTEEWQRVQGSLDKLFEASAIVGADMRGLYKAGDAILSLYIKEIDVLTKEKLRAIRRMRAILTGIERRWSMR